jgi:hypothetical protein
VEFDVGKNRQSHEEDEGGVEEDETSLSDVAVI